MLVKMTNPMTGVVGEMEMPVTPTELAEWRGGAGPIQNVLPQLNEDQREFLISGLTPKDWEDMFGPKPDPR
jgi:hypothetical protein